MRSLKWNSSHAVFVTEIDDDHKEIFDAVAQLQAALFDLGSVGNLAPPTKRLAARIEDHFAHEERLMRAGRYDLRSWHERCHNAARKRVARLAKRIDSGDPAAGPALVAYLRGWLCNHTRLADRMLGAFLRNERRAAKIVLSAGTKRPDSCTWVDSTGDPIDPTASHSRF